MGIRHPSQPARVALMAACQRCSSTHSPTLPWHVQSPRLSRRRGPPAAQTACKHPGCCSVVRQAQHIAAGCLVSSPADAAGTNNNTMAAPGQHMQTPSRTASPALLLPHRCSSASPAKMRTVRMLVKEAEASSASRCCAAADAASRLRVWRRYRKAVHTDATITPASTGPSRQLQQAGAWQPKVRTWSISDGESSTEGQVARLECKHCWLSHGVPTNRQPWPALTPTGPLPPT